MNIEISKQSATPLYVQLNEQIRLLIHRGALKPDDAMPTVRTLAVQLKINANTVARVYRDLQRDGLLRLQRGIGTFVAQSVAEQALNQEDYRMIRHKALALIKDCNQAGLRVGELKQLIATLWKEVADEG